MGPRMLESDHESKRSPGKRSDTRDLVRFIPRISLRLCGLLAAPSRMSGPCRRSKLRAAREADLRANGHPATPRSRGAALAQRTSLSGVTAIAGTVHLPFFSKRSPGYAKRYPGPYALSSPHIADAHAGLTRP